jgi:hypothetical protein
MSIAKENGRRATKYDEKLAINASFEDIIKLSVEPHTPAPKKEKKPTKKK